MRSIPLLLALLIASLLPSQALAKALEADVVVVVDTSVSMKEPGMDPERTSLLVAHLLSDLVPGDLAVVRLLDYGDDKALLPSAPTGRKEPCLEDPSKTCDVIMPTADWNKLAREGRLGVLARPTRGDAGFRQQLAEHLEQKRANSDFGLAFSAALGLFDQHGQRENVGRTVVWLSDGRSADEVSAKRTIQELNAARAPVYAVLFGRGDPRLAREAGLDPLQTSSPPELMKAFAGIFRHIVGAPYDLDDRVASAPSFEMKPHVDEAWVVVYGDATLGEVYLDGPQGRVEADYAQSSWPTAGAYRVAHMTSVKAGTWTVHATGGGAEVAYAVVQLSDLSPVLLGPAEAIAGSEVAIVGGLRAGLEGEPLTDPEVLADFTLTAEVEGNTVTLVDDGTGLDAVAGDGRFTGPYRFVNPGSIAVGVHARSELVDRVAPGTVEVSSLFEYNGPPLQVDFGSLGAEAEVCRPLSFSPRHEGEVDLELESLRSLPPGHRIEARNQGRTLVADGRAVKVGPGGSWELCLVTSRRAPSSSAAGEPWAELGVAGSSLTQHRVQILATWEVHGMPWWLRWLWLIITIAVLAAIVFVVMGYVVPKRFARNLALIIVQDEPDLEEQRPLSIRSFSGVGIGFYRNARAYVLATFRVAGTPRGAVARLQQEKAGLFVYPEHGTMLFRETDGDWEPVPERGRRAYKSDTYRVGEGSLYFRITTS
ncbi:MAG: choice-of-anchor X domain-containing protein [Pseudomonadota bacterium]